MIGFPADRCFPVHFPLPWRASAYENATRPNTSPSAEESKESNSAPSAPPVPSSSSSSRAVHKALEVQRKVIGAKTTKTCRLCFEPGAYKRPCCNALFCDHCYVKNRRCPNCNVQTKQETMTGATYQMKVYSEHEECRVCLDPGLPRRCCGNYYCDACYYAAPNCRSCNTPVSKIDKEGEITKDAHMATVCLGWTLTLFLALVLVSSIAVVITAETATPIGIFDFRCHGFFRSCDITLCADMPADVPFGYAPLPSLSSWEKCSLSSEYKLLSKACVYDQNLYHMSDRRLGYDVCTTSFAGTAAPVSSSLSSSSSPSNAGVYIFEDVFEFWSNDSFTSNEMRSAKWRTISSGFANTFCGATFEPPYWGKKALAFRGPDARLAETQPLDVRGGARVEGYIFLPPLGFDVSNPLCKTGYIGTVQLEYTTQDIDDGNNRYNWTTLRTFDPAVLRSPEFLKFSVELPTEALSAQTRIRFSQPVYEAARDNWAIDNLRILKYLHLSQWTDRGDTPTYATSSVSTPFSILSNAASNSSSLGSNNTTSNISNTTPYPYSSTSSSTSSPHTPSAAASSTFSRERALAQRIVQQAQCCVDTDWCKKRFSAEERVSCPLRFPEWYTQDMPYLFRLSEIILCIVALLNIVRFLYYSSFDYIVHGRLPFHDELVELFSLPYVLSFYKRIPFEYRVWLPLPQKNAFTTNIHTTARLAAEVRSAYDDGEGEEDDEFLRKEEEMRRAQKEYEKKVKREKKKLEKRQKKKNFQASTIVVPVDKEYEKYMETFVLKEKKEPGVYDPVDLTYAENALPTELDRFRRQDVALLRVPLSVDDDPSFRRTFAICVLSVFVILFVFLLVYTPYYSLSEPLVSLGVSKSTLRMDSVFVLFLAGWCDLKEIVGVLKHHVPLRKRWLPTISVDLSDDVKALVVDHFVLPLAQIREVTAFAVSFAHALLAGLVVGCFPWCLFAQLLRNFALDYSAMRFVTPLLGTVMVVRAVLGPCFAIKSVWALQHWCACHFTVREAIGAAMKSESARDIAINTALGLSIAAVLVTAMVSVEHVAFVFVAGLVGGWFYGLLTGTAHDLPIKPWIYLTTLKPGYFMRLRKQQRCPCVYWGKYCTGAHNYEEVFVLYVTDEVKLTALLSRGVQGEQTV